MPCQSGEETMIAWSELLSSEQKTTEIQLWQPGVSMGEAPPALVGHLTPHCVILDAAHAMLYTVCAVDRTMT